MKPAGRLMSLLIVTTLSLPVFGTTPPPAPQTQINQQNETDLKLDRIKLLAAEINYFSHPAARAYACANLAAAYLELVEKGKAAKIANKALDDAKLIGFSDVDLSAEVLDFYLFEASEDRNSLAARETALHRLRIFVLQPIVRIFVELQRDKKILEAVQSFNGNDRDEFIQALLKDFAIEGFPDQAAMLIPLISDPVLKTVHLSELAIFYYDLKEKEKAEAALAEAMMVMETTSGSSQDKLLKDLALTASALGKPQLADQLANRVTDPGTLVETLALLIEAELKRGAKDRALQINEAALQKVGLINDDRALIENYSPLSTSFLEADLPEAARAVLNATEKLINSLSDADLRVKYQIALAKDFEQMAEYRDSLRILRSLTDPRKRTDQLLRVADSLRANGKAEEALALLPEALAAAETISVGAAPRANAIARVIAMYLKCGQAEKASQIAWGQKTIYDQAVALVKIVTVYLEQGEVAQAFVVAKTIPNAFRRSLAYSLVADWYLDHNDFEHTRQIIGQITAAARQAKEASFKSEILAQAAILYIRMKDFDQALPVIDQIETEQYQLKVYEELVEELITSGEPARAIMIAQTNSSPAVKRVLIPPIIEQLVKTGQYEPAINLTAAIVDPDLKEELTEKIITGLNKSGEYERALGLTETIADPEGKAELIRQIANDLAEAGDFEKLQTLIPGVLSEQELLVYRADRLLALGQWREALNLIRGLKDEVSRVVWIINCLDQNR